MSNQDLIDYMLRIKQSNASQTTNLQETIKDLNTQINSYNLQIDECNRQIALLLQYNDDVDLIITFIPPD